MGTYPQRRPNRLKSVSYDEKGAYFITICTKDKANLFWDVGAATRRPPECLSGYGRIAMDRIQRIDEAYDGSVHVDHSVVMPNHVHLLLQIVWDGRRIAAPTISTVINQFKGAVSKGVGFSCWQRSFHDHIIRNDADYRRIWAYIDGNPVKWEEDCFYVRLDEA